MSAEEMQFVSGILQNILGNDNEARKQAEQQLTKIKGDQPDQYCTLLTLILKGRTAYTLDQRALAAVLLRRNFTVEIDSPTNLWGNISQETRESLQAAYLELLQEETERVQMHKICDLISEVGGSLNVIEKKIWGSLLTVVYQYVTSEVELHIEAALKIYNGLF